MSILIVSIFCQQFVYIAAAVLANRLHSLSYKRIHRNIEFALISCRSKNNQHDRIQRNYVERHFDLTSFDTQ